MPTPHALSEYGYSSQDAFSSLDRALDALPRARPGQVYSYESMRLRPFTAHERETNARSTRTWPAAEVTATLVMSPTQVATVRVECLPQGNFRVMIRSGDEVERHIFPDTEAALDHLVPMLEGAIHAAVSLDTRVPRTDTLFYPMIHPFPDATEALHAVDDLYSVCGIQLFREVYVSFGADLLPIHFVTSLTKPGHMDENRAISYWGNGYERYDGNFPAIVERIRESAVERLGRPAIVEVLALFASGRVKLFDGRQRPRPPPRQVRSLTSEFAGVQRRRQQRLTDYRSGLLEAYRMSSQTIPLGTTHRNRHPATTARLNALCADVARDVDAIGPREALAQLARELGVDITGLAGSQICARLARELVVLGMVDAGYPGRLAANPASASESLLSSAPHVPLEDLAPQ